MNHTNERALLGAMMTGYPAIEEAIKHVSSSDLWADSDARIFDLIVSMYARREPVNEVDVSVRVADSSEPMKYGGVEYVSLLPGYAPSSANVGYYASEVRALSERRKLYRACMDAAEQLKGGAGQDSVSGSLMRALTASVGPRPSTRTDKDLDGLVERIERRAGGEVESMTPTGYVDLDDLCSGGLRGGELIIVGARTSVGKSAFALNMARQVAESSGDVLFISLEMPADQLNERVLSAVSGVPLWRIRKGELRHGQPVRLWEASEEMKSWSGAIITEDQRGMTIDDIVMRARAHATSGNVRMVIVDYLQKVKPSTRQHNREREVAEVAEGLFGLAQSLDVPVVALAQLNREASKADIPAAHHLRDSGAIEQDADVIIILHRPDGLTGAKDPIDLYVYKNRNGQLGALKLQFNREIQRMDGITSFTGDPNSII